MVTNLKTTVEQQTFKKKNSGVVEQYSPIQHGCTTGAVESGTATDDPTPFQRLDGLPDANRSVPFRSVPHWILAAAEQRKTKAPPLYLYSITQDPFRACPRFDPCRCEDPLRPYLKRTAEAILITLY